MEGILERQLLIRGRDFATFPTISSATPSGLSLDLVFLHFI